MLNQRKFSTVIHLANTAEHRHFSGSNSSLRSNKYPPISKVCLSKADVSPLQMAGKVSIDRTEKSLRHVAMVAKFLDDNKPKTSLLK